MGECTGGCSRGGEGSTGAWWEPKLLERRGAWDEAVGDGSSRAGAGAYCWPLPSVASVVRASAASYVVVWVKCCGDMDGRRSAGAAAAPWLRRESMLLMARSSTLTAGWGSYALQEANDGDDDGESLQARGERREARVENNAVSISARSSAWRGAASRLTIASRFNACSRAFLHTPPTTHTHGTCATRSR